MIITIVRKPIESSTTHNTRTYECGGINIGGTRIGDDLRFNQPSGTDNKCYNTSWVGKQTVGTHCKGRFPSNVVLSESSVSHLPLNSEKDQSGVAVAKYFLVVGD